MTRYLLDTTFVIDYLRDLPAAIARMERFFEDGDEPVTSEVVVCEAATGSPGGDDLRRFVEYTDFVQPHYDVALRAGELRAQARQRGRTLSLPHALIASLAEADDAVVLTRNVKDFALTSVRVETY